MSESKLFTILSGLAEIQQTMGNRLNWGKNPFLQAIDDPTDLAAFAVSANYNKVVVYSGADSRRL